MNTVKERILVVENDLEIGDLIVRQTLMPLGYHVQLVGSAALAIQEAVRFSPEVIIANLKLPGLSGKDMQVGLAAQGIDVPIIVVAEKGMESDVIQAFRLGAADFINTPLREAEVVSAVERVLKQTRARREREQLSRQLNQTNQELQRRVRELTTIFSIGKAVISITDQRALFDKIVEGAVFISEADLGWLLLKPDRSKTYLLSAQQNLPPSLVARLNQPWDDGLSSLVALSGESLSIHGDPIKRFKVAQLGQSALVVPLKVKNEVMGLLVAMRKKSLPFNLSSQALLEAVADYASISLVNARLFRALEERVQTFQAATEAAQLGERAAGEILDQTNQVVKEALPVLKNSVGLLTEKNLGSPANEHAEALKNLLERLQNIVRMHEAAYKVQQASPAHGLVVTNLTELVRQAAKACQPFAQQLSITWSMDLPSQAVQVLVNPAQMLRALQGLMVNATRQGSPAGERKLLLEQTSASLAHLVIEDQEAVADERILRQLFEKSPGVLASTTRSGGIGIGLPLVKEILAAQGGRIWAESKTGKGIAYHCTLPINGG